MTFVPQALQSEIKIAPWYYNLKLGMRHGHYNLKLGMRHGHFNPKELKL
ncbi:hypothetical protein [Kroppenstedtia sanguinis]|uniref:Uncharacterized protein n=1 Tax=Kroppenstedtia sanguinis TaxID=1380684 RepID=A0ABW4CAW8_9BACL